MNRKGEAMTPRREKSRRPDGMTLFFMAISLVAAALLYRQGGLGAIGIGLEKSMVLLISVSPVVVLALLLAGYAQTLIPRRWVETRLGQRSGRGGTALACLAGALMPGGPFAAFPVVLVLRQSGAALGTCVAFLTAWSVLGLHRMIIWEIPWLGWRFALLRWLISLPLPWLAAWAMYHLDARINSKDAA